MAIRARIRCIRKNNRQSPWERIEYVGGVDDNGKQFHFSLDDAIAHIEANRYDFYVEEPSRDVVRVIVMPPIGIFGRKFLKTTRDGDLPNNLLSLPECPQTTSGILGLYS